MTLCFVLATVISVASADPFQLLTGVDAGLTPGATRTVPSQAPGGLGFFQDGDRLAGTIGTESAAWMGTGSPMIAPNASGSLSFLFRRGSFGLFGAPQTPVMAIEYLGGPLLDLDGDLNDGVRHLTRVAGQTPVVIPGSTSFLDLGFGGSSVTLNQFDVTGTNSGSQNLSPDFGVTVNVLAGTQPDASQTGPINPTIDTRQGMLTPVATGVTRIENLGYEFWQDSVAQSVNQNDPLGSFQSLGALGGWLIERDAGGAFPVLAGTLGSTLWPAVDTSQVGNSFNTSFGGMSAITDGVPNDLFSAAGNGGLPLMGGDLGAYLDSVVVPLIDPLSNSFVYLESAGFGISNSGDPVFGSTNGYDAVLIAQSAPIPEPATGLLILIASGLWFRPRRRRLVR
ncbi:MAG: hypothetical protein ACE5EQ_03855 [Phycisphaerae bacterium]